MLKTGLSLLLLAALCPFILSDHTEVCDLDGSRCYYEPALDSGTKKVLAVEIKSTTVDVTVFPCYGEFTWNTGTSASSDESTISAIDSHAHSFMVHLDTTHEDGMHGEHIVEKHSFSGLTVGEYIYVILDANMDSDVVAQIEVLQGSSTSLKPTVGTIAVERTLNMDDGTLKLEWAEATAPAGSTGCASIEYKAYYHMMSSMHTGMVMGTYCGTTHTMEDHDDMHGRKLQHDHGDHGGHGGDSSDIHTLVEVDADSSTTCTVPDLNYEQEYHIEVMAICMDSNGQPTYGTSYQPFMLEGDWYVEGQVNTLGNSAAALKVGKFTDVALSSAFMFLAAVEAL
ncbi:hypothetical protein TrVE_jg591 [Triparma verrucosa]|uniref:Uncharacterized protein n=1 Tax=Triparma verrucosa TaxID=1606542 RepID=A0A9W7B115_9STRA|nr:hypothetical protein TrVE_jg591 [Triparma verrucosa]